ncbi:MAG: hypothetical protein NW237_02995 [Cyanobacteriota bacterium]|nr:hypothetical protein [Cyanobacteriota bacterium]
MSELKSDPDQEWQDFAQRLERLQGQWKDLQELAQLEKLPPERWAEAQQQLADLETRMQEYLGSFNPYPSLFWQVVRFVGLGLVIGVALGRWLGS